MEKRKVFKISIIDKEISRTEFDRNTFYTSDSELSLVFKLIEKDYKYDHGEILLYNENDKSFITRAITKKENDFVYELDLDIIPHYGTWKAQLQLVKDGDVYTSKPFEFNIVNDLSNLAPQPTLTDINNWSTLKQSAAELIDEMQDIILDVERSESERVKQENHRQQAESERVSKENKRKQAESERVNKEKSRQIGELERENKESQRQSTFESNETERQTTFESNESERQSAELIRVENENQRNLTIVVNEYEPTLKSGYVGGSAGKEKIRIYKDGFGFVHIHGRVEGSTLFGASNPVFNVPVELRPAHVQAGAICLNSNPSSVGTGIRIMTNSGNCYFTSAPPIWTLINFSYFAGL